MVTPPGGPSPAREAEGLSSQPPTPTPALFYAMSNLWFVFNGASGSSSDPNYFQNAPYDTPQWWAMFAQAGNEVMQQMGTEPDPSTDPTAYKLWTDFHTTLCYDSSGNPVTLASICDSSNPSASALALAGDFQDSTIFSSVMQDLQGGDIDAWFAPHYPGGTSTEPPPIPPSGFSQSTLNAFMTDLQTWEQNRGIAADGDAVVADVLALYTTLSGTSPLDGYAQNLLNLLTAPIDSKGDSLYSLCKAIHAAGGCAADPTDANALGNGFFELPQLSPPFGSTSPPFQDPQSILDQLRNWLVPTINAFEWPSS